MNSFHQKLLLTLAVSLCILCAYQWYGQTLQRKEIQTLTQLAYEKATAIRDYTNSIVTLNHQIAQMDARISELKESVRTNEQLVIIQKREINRVQAASEGLTNQIAEYKKAVDTLETKLKEAYDGINKQNESIKQLVAERDEVVKKLNDSVKERNEIVARYNELAARVEKSQSGGTKQ